MSLQQALKWMSDKLRELKRSQMSTSIQELENATEKIIKVNQEIGIL